MAGRNWTLSVYALAAFATATAPARALDWPELDGFDGPSWTESAVRLTAAGRPKTAEEILSALRSGEPAEVYASLRRVRDGHGAVGRADLTGVLERAKAPLLAQAAIFVLASRGDAWAPIAAHVEARGPGEAFAIEALAETRGRHGSEALLDRAGDTAPGDSAGLAAIRALAYVPGDRAIILLRRLAKDWDEEIRDTARFALDLRSSLGMRSTVAIKAAPVGRPIAEIAAAKGTDRYRQMIASKRKTERQSRPEATESDGFTASENGGVEEWIPDKPHKVDRKAPPLNLHDPPDTSPDGGTEE